MFEKIINRNCLITGATGGIGKKLVELLLQNNCNVFLTAKNNSKLKNLAKSLDHYDSQIFYYAADLSSVSSTKSLIKKVRKEFKSVDILINCAGIFKIKSISSSSLVDYDLSMNINLKAPFILSKEFSKDMIKKKWGRIVNLGSSSSYAGFKNGTVYCTSKHGILGLSRALQNELKQYNVRVFCISPASTQTEMAKISSDQDFSTFLNPNEVAKFIIYSISFDSEMIVDEVKLNRMIMK